MQINSNEAVILMEQVTNKLMNTYKEINQLCKDKIKNFEKQAKSTKDAKKLEPTSAGNQKREFDQRSNKAQETNKNKKYHQEKKSRVEQRPPEKKSKPAQNNSPAPNSYLAFFQQRQPQICAKNPKLSIPDVSRIVAQEWELLQKEKKEQQKKLKGDPQKSKKEPEDKTSSKKPSNQSQKFGQKGNKSKPKSESDSGEGGSINESDLNLLESVDERQQDDQEEEVNISAGGSSDYD